MKKLFFDWKVHLFCIIFVVAAEVIGSVVVGPVPILGANIGFTIFPMLFAMLFGIAFYLLKIIDKDTVVQATPYIGIATMWLISKLAIGIGPNLEALAAAGPAFILQEIGNLGTAILAIPVAVFVFNMGKQAIGASFSKSREGSIALISSMYGLDSPEGQGTMGAYIVGTVLGTLFCGILASIIISLGIFDPRALAMASGSGSASMMAAFLAPLEHAYPQYWDELVAIASMSNLITAATGLYFSMFVVIPICKWMYKVFKGEKRHHISLKKKGLAPQEPAVATTKSAQPKEKAKLATESLSSVWFTRLKVLALSGLFGVIANTITTSRNPNVATVGVLEGLYALLFLLLPVILGCIVYDIIERKLDKRPPIIIFISLIGILLSIPALPFAEQFIQANNQIGLLPLTVPILAYAGISLGKDLKTFKQQGLAIVCITLLAFAGTYLGSAIIAHIYLAFIG